MNSIEANIYETLTRLPKEWDPKYTATEHDHRDGILTIRLGENIVELDVEARQIRRKENLNTVINRISQSENIRVIYTNPLSDFLRAECEKLGLNYIDEAGNIRIVDKNLYILLNSNQKNSEYSEPDYSQTMSIGIVKCVFALYSETELLHGTYQEIASKADISVGMVHKAMNYLIHNKYIPRAKQSRRILNPDQLLHEWLISYRNTIVAKRKPISFPPPVNWQDIELVQGALWGGEVAAYQLTEYLNPKELLLYCSEKIQKYPLSKQDAPTLKVCKPFWGTSLDISKQGHALLTVGDLLASNDGRNREVAELINERYLRIKTLPGY